MDFSVLSAFLDSLVEDKGIPGVDMVIYQDHTSIFRHNAGFRDVARTQPVRHDDTYFIYSCTKPITCACALSLFEKGAFLMSDPLSDYLPEFKNMTVREIDDRGNERVRPAKREIEIRDLFTMTAGFDYDLNTPEIKRAIAETGGEAPTREIIRALAQKPLCFDPGEHWSYSLCLDVLAAFVEVVSGMRFETFMRKTLFEPLGMKSSAMHLTDALSARLAAQYERNGKTNVISPIPAQNAYILGARYDSGGAGLVTCVDDYIRFADAMACGGVGLTGERILSPATINLMRENHLNPRQLADLTWIQMRGYGYGLGVRTMIDRTQGSLSSLGEFGWGGAAGAYALIDPERHLSAYFAEHMLNSYEPYVHPRLRNILYAAFEA